MRSRTFSISIARAPADVYAFVREPANLPRWARGLGTSARQDGEKWLVETDQGPLMVQFAPDNELGVLDHVVTPPAGEPVLVPMRVVPNGGGSEVLFTLFQQPGMSDEQFAADARLVQQDLQRLKDVLEQSA